MSADLDLTDDDLDQDDQAVTTRSRVPGVRRATVTTTAPAVAVATGPSVGKTYLSAADEAWTWRELRDYVVDMAKKTHGQLLSRDPIQEKAIFSSFISRHGAVRAVAIARYAFETSPHPGYWMSSPIRPTRFAKGSDPSFADKIVAERLT